MDDRTVIEALDLTEVEKIEDGDRPIVRGWLTIWNGFLKGRDFPLYNGRNFVGSDDKCDICITDIHFPRFAFNIRISQTSWTLIDLDSDTGVWLDDRSVFRQEIRDQAWIKTANLLLRVKKR